MKLWQQKITLEPQQPLLSLFLSQASVNEHPKLTHIGIEY